MRIIITTRTELASVYADMMNRLVNILALISKNPSNPNFNQYTFESISALIRFIVPVAPGALQAFEAGLLGPMSFILREDIDRKLHEFVQNSALILVLQSLFPIPSRSSHSFSNSTLDPYHRSTQTFFRKSWCHSRGRRRAPCLVSSALFEDSWTRVLVPSFKTSNSRLCLVSFNNG